MATTRATPASVVALRFDGAALWAIDQTELPWRERELELRTAEDVAGGDPAPRDPRRAADRRRRRLRRRTRARARPLGGGASIGPATILRDARPDGGEPQRGGRPRVRQRRAPAAPTGAPPRSSEARAIEAEEEAASDAIAAHGAELLAGARRILTHCNTGALAAPGRGTALAVVAEKAQRGTLDSVLATESRPLLQGARLTTYELARLNIPHELIVDSAAAGLIAGGAVDAVIVGCDRVAANGDVANKVGTYGLALAAHAAGIPFVVAGPTSTIDPNTPDGARHHDRGARPRRGQSRWPGQRITLDGTRCRNPAFDVTPAALISALVTERGVIRSPDAEPSPRTAPSSKMRVARSFAPGDVRIEEAPEPEAGPGEVVCDVLACGVCGSDVTDWYIAPRLPAVLGHEVIGTVRARRRRRRLHRPPGPAWRSTTTRRAASAGVAGAATRRCASGSARRALTPAGSPSACGSCPSSCPSCSSSRTASTR